MNRNTFPVKIGSLVNKEIWQNLGIIHQRWKPRYQKRGMRIWPSLEGTAVMSADDSSWTQTAGVQFADTSSLLLPAGDHQSGCLEPDDTTLYTIQNKLDRGQHLWLTREVSRKTEASAASAKSIRDTKTGRGVCGKARAGRAVGPLVWIRREPPLWAVYVTLSYRLPTYACQSICLLSAKL